MHFVHMTGMISGAEAFTVYNCTISACTSGGCTESASTSVLTGELRL